MRIKAPYPRGPLGPNTAPVHPAGGHENEPAHVGAQAVSRRALLDGKRHAWHLAHKSGDTALAGQLAAEIAELEAQ